jgi:DNA polymerase-1
MVEVEDGLSLIYSDYQITGAETGRMSASGGMHNIPIRDTKDFRKCFIARPEHKLIIADFDSQEARITAYLTQDEYLIKILRSGKKIYIVAAEEIFGKKGIQKGDSEYSKMKSTFLGMDYGMSYYGLADRENISQDEAIKLIDEFFKLFPGIKTWIERQKQLTKTTYTVLSRKAYLNPYSDQCERNALNNPVQGTASDITKRSLGYIHKYWDVDYYGLYGIVGVYHDEIVDDSHESVAQDVKDYISRLMVRAAEEICVGIPFKVDATIADNWSEK